MPFGIPWRRVNCHPAFPVAKPAVDHAPCMGARSRFSDCPALFFRMLQSVSNISVGMAGHDLALLLVVFQLQQLYHHGTAERRIALQPLRACLAVVGQRALRSATKKSITKAWRRTAHSARFWAVRGFSPVGRRSSLALGHPARGGKCGEGKQPMRVCASREPLAGPPMPA